MAAPKKSSLSRLRDFIADAFGLEFRTALAIVGLAAAATAAAVFWFVKSAPPRVLVMTSGPAGSSAENNALRYARSLERSGVKLRILPSDGSLENLKRLADPAFRVDVGFVQGGEAGGVDASRLASLGVLNHQPLLIFYRGPHPIELLSQLKGKRVALGALGSGTRALAAQLLTANGIEPGGGTTLKTMEPQEALEGLLAGRLDAAFLMGDSAPRHVIARLMRAPGIRLYDFTQADGYARRFNFLSRIDLPRGAIDLGAGIPKDDVRLIGPTVELIARGDLDPALSDLLLEAATEVHASSGLFRRRGEFPVLQEHEFRLSPAAVRYYKSGKSFVYRALPFALASVLNRILISFVPLLVLLIPVLKAAPAIYRWRINSKIFRWYRELLRLEEDMAARAGAANRPEFLKRLDKIEEAVHDLSVPAPFADQFYELRGHIRFVRSRLLGN